MRNELIRVEFEEAENLFYPDTKSAERYFDLMMKGMNDGLTVDEYNEYRTYIKNYTIKDRKFFKRLLWKINFFWNYPS